VLQRVYRVVLFLILLVAMGDFVQNFPLDSSNIPLLRFFYPLMAMVFWSLTTQCEAVNANCNRDVIADNNLSVAE